MENWPEIAQTGLKNTNNVLFKQVITSVTCTTWRSSRGWPTMTWMCRARWKPQSSVTATAAVTSSSTCTSELIKQWMFLFLYVLRVNTSTIILCFTHLYRDSVLLFELELKHFFMYFFLKKKKKVKMNILTPIQSSKYFFQIRGSQTFPCQGPPKLHVFGRRPPSRKRSFRGR